MGAPNQYDKPTDTTDVVLIVGSRKFYLSRQWFTDRVPVLVLMHQDPRMEIWIGCERAGPELFLGFLHCLDRLDVINEDNAIGILRWAERFECKIVLDQIEQFFLNSSQKSATEKLKIAMEYKFLELQRQILNNIKSAEEFWETLPVSLTEQQKIEIARMVHEHSERESGGS
ncbi:hypothetical protein GCK72_007539 [Caenorhabditis remanei]|uniref:BTB domain-containing protein n=1 Tax=Caenorhabditis remanei TaxID=31234 RepID=A0A6A5HHJ9_CAERE|nr:hypothetical protein GCK72_007539 [Caenorhabditis remanei]KAF1767580.1 hypothetical protein GCK72_007539 [Caenorhabditis remanei]